MLCLYVACSFLIHWGIGQCPWHICPSRMLPVHPSRIDSCENHSLAEFSPRHKNDWTNLFLIPSGWNQFQPTWINAVALHLSQAIVLGMNWTIQRQRSCMLHAAMVLQKAGYIMLYNLIRDQHAAHVQHSNFDNESKWCRNVSAMTTHDACNVQPQVRFKSCKPWCMIHHDPTLPPPVFPIHASWRMWSHLLLIGDLKINLANMMCSFDHDLMHWGSNAEKYGNILNDLKQKVWWFQMCYIY